MKRVLALFLAIAFAVIAGGCGNSGEQGAMLTEDPNEVPSDTYEINWYLMGTPQEDISSVEMAINDYLKDKINATVKIHAMDAAQYEQKMNTMIQAGEYFDIAFAARWMLDYFGNSEAGAYFPMGDYFDKYMPESSKQMDPDQLESIRVSDGKVYGLPVHKEYAGQIGWIYRKDIADKYGINMADYKTVESLKPVLETIKANEPDMQYPIDWDNDSAPRILVEQESNIFRNGMYSNLEVVNYMDTPEFKKACEVARDFYESGLVKKDVLTTHDTIQRMKEGKCFCMLSPLKPGKVEELFKNTNYEFAQQEITAARVDYMPGAASMQVISATSKNPARCMRFLELLNTDPVLMNLVIYGIEGKHYNKIDENTVQIKQGTTYDFSANAWAVGNNFIVYLTDKDDPQKHEKLKELNDNAERLVSNLFMFDDKGDNEMIQIQTELDVINSRYMAQATTGALDPGPILEQWKEEWKAAGGEKYIEEMSKQYEEFLKKYPEKVQETIEREKELYNIESKDDSLTE
ncbi:ABC transporter substrate-binding protein [Ructibacterium gallinarum]|uniref:Extracellular solute-binding protein n=1 Tax=Ructibacterium gallinarum TaxID=2779355 RepID=A0A9D5M554_9FIRM|nr:extracellular solute-binding protein [Ructibacterium gallinarum]MBE5040889.1 extracellular solute-binding protein [Ructibacterium gallinarum]